MPEYDLVVIGGGPGGYVAALRAAQMGAKVALVEKRDLGGTCLNRGCIPTKTYLETAHRLWMFGQASDFGITAGDARVDLDSIRRRKQGIVQQLRRGVKGLLAARGVELLEGEAKLDTARSVIVDGEETIRAPKVVLATGSSSLIPPLFQRLGARVLDAERALDLEAIPDRLTVVGGGMVGVEMASIFQAFGSSVTLVEKLPHLLPTEEEAAGKILRSALEMHGVQVVTGQGVQDVSMAGDVVDVILEGDQRHVADQLLVAVGRAPNVDGVGLEAAGIELSNGFIGVDERMQTSVPGVFAVGDVAGPPMLAHVAFAEGIVAASNAAGEAKQMQYEATPFCAYSSPEVARVGLTEEMARAERGQLKIGEYQAAHCGRAMSMGMNEGYTKIIADAETHEILGATIVGDNASELIHELVLAVANELTLECLAETMHGHPTLSEMTMEACLDALGSPLHGV